MRKINRRITILILIAVGVMGVVTTLYYLGMNHLEDRPRTLLQSFEFVIQTMTTVGYGQDAGWESPWMYLLVIFTQLAGIGIVFLSIPIVLNPWLQERLALRAPREYSGPGDHVILTQYSDIMDGLIEVLDERGIPYVLVDNREPVTMRLLRENRRVVSGKPEERETLRRVRAGEARLVILDGPDQYSASVSLALQEYETLRVLALASKADRAMHLSSAGVDKVFYPRRVIGEALAHKALSGLGRSVDRNLELSEHLEIEEFPVLDASPLIGQSLRESRIRSKTGAHVVGVWREGEFHNAPEPTFTIRHNDLIVAAGTPDQLDRLGDLSEHPQSRKTRPGKKVLIVGFGNEGQAARKTLIEAGIDPVVINDQEREHVDILGDGMDPEVLQEAGIEEAATMIVTVSNDETATMVTLIARRLNPGMEILVQIHDNDSSESLYRAGASYVFSLDQISSRMLAEEVLGESLLNYRLNIKMRRCPAGKLAGRSLSREEIGENFQVSILGVERNGEFMTELDETFTFESGDEIVAMGSDQNVDRFARNYAMDESSPAS